MQLQGFQNKIREVREHKILFDFDLAELYEVENKRLKEVVRRNISRFPADFIFERMREEHFSLRKQFATLENQGRVRHSKFSTFAFTEQGVAMPRAYSTVQKRISQKGSGSSKCNTGGNRRYL